MGADLFAGAVPKEEAQRAKAAQRLFGWYTAAVISRVAEEVRRATTARVLEMAVPERIALALALGDQDLALFARVNGLDRQEALRRLRAQRRRGRTPSACTGALD